MAYADFQLPLFETGDPASLPEAANDAERTSIRVADAEFTALANGSLWRQSDRLLIVADLHLEKGSSFARRGQMLPPYDTAATLAALSILVFGFDPATVIALGDSFHDNDGARRMSGYDRAALSALMRGRNWVWIAGNHDDDIPREIGGDHAESVSLGKVTLRHEPLEGAAGEIAGHLHPAARIAGRRGSLRRRCFAGDGNRLILPAFGAYAGGLNVLDQAFSPLFNERFTAFLLGHDTVYSVPSEKLRTD